MEEVRWIEGLGTRKLVKSEEFIFICSTNDWNPACGFFYFGLLICWVNKVVSSFFKSKVLLFFSYMNGWFPINYSEVRDFIILVANYIHLFIEFLCLSAVITWFNLELNLLIGELHRMILHFKIFVWWANVHNSKIYEIWTHIFRGTKSSFFFLEIRFWWCFEFSLLKINFEMLLYEIKTVTLAKIVVYYIEEFAFIQERIKRYGSLQPLYTNRAKFWKHGDLFVYLYLVIRIS